MNTFFKLAAMLSLSVAATHAWAAETIPEKATVIKNDVKRATKKAVNRVEEAVCAKSDAECLARKAKNRATETGDVVIDKVSETKNKVD